MRLFEGTPFDIPPTCEHCGLLESVCQCSPEMKMRAAPERQTACISTTKRKHGRVVTIISGLEAVANDLPALLTKLKIGCGAGGTIDGNTLEIQGDQASRVREILTKLGYKTRSQ